MSRRHPLPSLVLLATLTLAACGGSAESAEEPAGAQAAPEAAPVEEAPVPEPEVTPASEAAPAPSGPTAPVRQPTRTAPAATESSAPAEAPAPAASPAPARAVAAGTALTLTLDRELGTERNRAGDAFAARLTVDLLLEDGEVLLPAGTVVRGTVAEATRSPNAETPAVLRLEVTGVEVAGETLPVAASVEEVQLKADAMDRNRETVGKVAAGTAAGAILGKVLGNNAKRGAAVGAAAGAVVAYATRDGHASVPEGSLLVIRLVEPLVLR
ncbi:MAG: hypothetical protein AMXMBFR53_05010 [Gemmatimonadota bacterium]